MGRSGKSRPQTGTPALVVLDRAEVHHTVHRYEHDPTSDAGYGLEAATVLGVEPRRVFKTLVASVDESLVVAVIPVDHLLDLKALASAVGGKRAAMAQREVAERSTGYVIGGISPLGQRQPLRTIVDVTSLEHPTIYVSAGRRGLDVEIAPADLVSITSGSTARIGRT